MAARPSLEIDRRRIRMGLVLAAVVVAASIVGMFPVQRMVMLAIVVTALYRALRLCWTVREEGAGRA